MHVIGHDYITTNPDVKFLCAPKRIFSKRFVRSVQAINFASLESTYCNKKKRRIIRLKNLLQPRWALFDHGTSLGAASTSESSRAEAMCLRHVDGSIDLVTKPARERNHPA